jgi:outer membrane protein OmpA-like peptidoglycan-associated protein
MKKRSTYLGLLMVLGLGILSLSAQDRNNPFKITVGTNAVDAFPTNAVNPYETGKLFEEYFNVADHWNFIAAPTYFAGSIYLQDGFSFGLRGSLNKISSLGNTPVNKLYMSLDGAFQYAFLKDTKLDPYLSVGMGKYWMGPNSSFTVNGGLGINYWFSDFVGLTLESNYKHTKNINGVAHLQHSLGISIKGGGSDRDKDGVYDGEDSCPDIAGLPQFNGCPDSDGDGIPDPEDDCPNSPGLAEFNGCPDSDGDGIIDSKDNCPTQAGSLAHGGCPDSDSDGIIDAKDNCPNVAGVPENNGCPEVQKQLDSYAKTILFVNEEATFLEESLPSLAHILNIVKEYPEATFTVSGHADSRGTEQFNQELSEKRAQAVIDYLTEKGIKSSRFKAVGYGESMPISTNKNRAGRKLNRRVEVVVNKS